MGDLYAKGDLRLPGWMFLEVRFPGYPPCFSLLKSVDYRTIFFAQSSAECGSLYLFLAKLRSLTVYTTPFDLITVFRRGSESWGRIYKDEELSL